MPKLPWLPYLVFKRTHTTFKRQFNQSLPNVDQAVEHVIAIINVDLLVIDWLEVNLPAMIDLHCHNKCGSHIYNEEYDVEPFTSRVKLVIYLYMHVKKIKCHLTH